MGRPKQTPPARPAADATARRDSGLTSRRGFFARSGAATVALAAAGPLAPLAAGAAPRGLFQHGVASGDPLADRVILWTRVTPQVAKDKLRVDWVIARDPELADVAQTGSVVTDAAQDWTVKVDPAGLQPGSTYYYRFSVGGVHSPVGRTRTLPVGALEHLRLAVVSCSNFAAGYFNAYRRIAERADLDAVVHLGDYLYEYGDGQYGSTRPCDPPHEIVTLDDYRRRHAQYKGDPDSQEMLRQHPLIAIWDDHETANNAWVAGAENHQPDGEGAWPARVAAALQAYHEWMPVRPVKKDLRRDNHRYAFGDLVDLFTLEERLTGRSEQLTADIPTPFGMAFAQAGEYLNPARSILGAQGEQWITGQLRKSTARWKLLGQGVMFAQLKAVGAPNAQGGGLFLNPDQWDGYQPARNRLYDVVQGSDGRGPVRNVVVLTGDIHSSWAADLTRDPNNPDVRSGGYDPVSGEGALAVEFVATSVSSPGLDDPGDTLATYLRSQNPHFKYIDLNRRGYLVIDATPERLVGEYWQLETVAAPDGRQTLAAAFAVHDGTARLVPSPGTASRRRRVPPAP